jgi:DNA-directed RNA polymerase specialized sigma24 family protein
MSTPERLAELFEPHRPHGRAVAYRMLGSVSEADDAVQEAWIRLNRTDVGRVDNLRGSRTKVVARVCLDMLRTRTSGREDPFARAGSDRPRDRPCGQRARNGWHPRRLCRCGAARRPREASRGSDPNWAPVSTPDRPAGLPRRTDLSGYDLIRAACTAECTLSRKAHRKNLPSHIVMN